MEKHLFLGDEAIAQAAIDAGLSCVYDYPGTPSTEITEYIQGSPIARERGIPCKWSANETTAMEAALGMSDAGKRSLCCMKHVGLNVAADCFMNAAMSGINGGMIIVTADDPSMHSSQNEQDNRMFGNFAMVPMLEPSSQQEAYDMVYHGFDPLPGGRPAALYPVARLGARTFQGVDRGAGSFYGRFRGIGI